jgi:hypothetical protein
MTKERQRALVFSLGFMTFLAFAVCGSLTLLQGCGVLPARGSSSYAEQIPGPEGVKCYAIVEDGRTVGGNCK